MEKFDKNRKNEKTSLLQTSKTRTFHEFTHNIPILFGWISTFFGSIFKSIFKFLPHSDYPGKPGLDPQLLESLWFAIVSNPHEYRFAKLWPGNSFKTAFFTKIKNVFRKPFR